MKKTLVITTLLLGAASGYSQGVVNFYNFVNGFHQIIYNVSTANNATVTYGGFTVQEEQGSSAADTPTGSTVYSGAPLGGSTASSTQYMAQLLAAPSFDQPLSALVPVGVANTFQTVAAGAGYLNGAKSVTANATGLQATVAIAAWNDGNGLYTTLAAAQAAGEPWGISGLSNITGIAPPSTGAFLSTGSNVNMSFSLGTVPEPSTIALGVMGASTLLFRRRK